MRGRRRRVKSTRLRKFTRKLLDQGIKHKQIQLVVSPSINRNLTINLTYD